MSLLSNYAVSLYGNDIDKKREEIKEYFNNTYELFEKVFELLKDDNVFYRQSELTRHPMIFYFGHTATFFINKLINMKIITKRVNKDFESIFAVGVDEMSWDDLEQTNYKWPSVDSVREYRNIVKNIVNNLIDNIDFSLPINDKSDMWIILMGIEHERIHIETSLVLHRQMELKYIKNVKDFKVANIDTIVPKNSMVDIPSSYIILGKDKQDKLYGWDNEYGKYEDKVEAFKVSKYLVSNGEFLEFVLDGGYENLSFWDEEGRVFLKNTRAKHPHFWVKDKDSFRYRTLSSIVDMFLSWPVEVNALESEAFCRYKSFKDGIKYSLMSEVEYRAIYDYVGLKDIPNIDETKANINFAHYTSSMPVDSFEFNGIYDVIGNVWQWSKTPIRGFLGFEVHKAYDDFSTPTFDEKHSLILGSSWASSGNLIMKHSRYAFRKHFFQFAGFRYVVSDNVDKIEDIYISDEEVVKQFNFEYDRKKIEIDLSCVKRREKALNLHCGTGRFSFELAKEFNHVDGIDLSVRFISVGSKLKDNKSTKLDDLNLSLDSKRLDFWQGDIYNLKPHLNSYDLIFVDAFKDIEDIKLFIDGIKDRLVDGGVLVVKDIEKDRDYLENNFEFISNNIFRFGAKESRVSMWRNLL